MAEGVAGTRGGAYREAQARAVAVVARGGTLDEAAAASGRSLRSLRRWLAAPLFAAALA